MSKYCQYAVTMNGSVIFQQSLLQILGAKDSDPCSPMVKSQMYLDLVGLLNEQ